MEKQKKMTTQQLLQAKQRPSPFLSQDVSLSSQDLITYKNRLKDSLEKFISFEAYSLYFPTGKMSPFPKWAPEEKKLLLPLVYNGNILGVFAGSNVSMKDGQLDILEKISAICLENLALFKKSLIEPGSGLYTRQYLLENITATIIEIQNSMSFGPGANTKFDLSITNQNSNIGGSFAVLVANFSPMTRVSREYGFSFADKFTLALANAFRETLPEQALVASIGDTSFAVYLPNRAYSECLRLGKEICENMGEVELVDPLTRVKVSLPVAVGFACYPLDMEATFTCPSPLEQAMQIVKQARLSSGRAWDAPGRTKSKQTTDFDKAHPFEANLLGFAEILTHGGKVVKTLPMSRVEVNLGLGMGAREGMHFKVFSPSIPEVSGLAVAEITLSDVNETMALGEIIHLNNPTRPITEGDRLELLPDIGLDEIISGQEKLTSAKRTKGQIPALLSHRDFLANFAAEREKCSQFSLALLRLFPSEIINREAENDISESDILTKAVNLILDELKPLNDKGAFSARYGLHSLIVFIPGQNPEKIVRNFKEIAKKSEQTVGVEVACGISMYPFLNYRKSDSLDNTSKALNYALLLEKPRVGLLNSLGLNIRADRHFSQADIFGAIGEYKQALLADENNVWAWTSLGVCFAGIGSLEESRRAFETALSKDPNDIMALYNLAQVLQTKGKRAEAKQYYEYCLKINPEHVFSMLRLGQMAENAANYDKAEEYFKQAGKLPQGEVPASRHMARLALTQNKQDEAREHLHKALAKKPDDSLALSMLADVYLDAGDNPEIALSLARQSVALRPDYSMGWLGLARAYEACNEPEQAQLARLRAAEI